VLGTTFSVDTVLKLVKNLHFVFT